MNNQSRQAAACEVWLGGVGQAIVAQRNRDHHGDALPAQAEFRHRERFVIDAVYPALLALSLAGAILRLAPARWGFWRWLLAATAVPGMVFDYWENADVASMLDLGPDGITPAFVATASFHSQAKAALTTVSMGILLILLLLWAYRRWRAPHNPV